MDLSVYLIASMAYGIEKIEEALKAGVSIVQLREKNISSKQYFEAAKRMKELTRTYNVPLIINDRVDIALAVGADGVHLGQSDLPIDAVRTLVGDNFIIGATAKTLEDALLAEQRGANYIGSGAWFSTSTKLDATPLDLEVYRQIRSQLTIPTVAIGGVTRENCQVPFSYGADGVAMAKGLLEECYIEEAIAEIKYKRENRG